jgi:hypothetical protein
MLDTVQFVTGAEVVLNVTVPTAVPKLAPVIVTAVPMGPFIGLRVAMPGAAGETVKFTALLGWLPTVTTTFPVVAPAGTAATILVGVQIVAGEVIPLNVTLLVP